MTNHWNPNSLFEILADERARQILVATNIKPRSAQDLVDICDASDSAIYRRVDVMTDYGLLKKEQKIDLNGHHYCVYTAHPDKIEVEIGEGSILVDFTNKELNMNGDKLAKSPDLEI
ncbi:hypothetical protein GCM10028857_03530 [Salinarchaeum chitinilyticum]